MNMDKKDSFLLYASFYDSIQHFSQAAKAQMLDAIFIYANDGTVIENMLPVVAAVFPLIKTQIDINHSNYQKRCEQNQRIAQEAWERRKAQEEERKRLNANVSERLPETANVSERLPNDNDYGYGSDSGSESDNGSGNDYNPLLPPPQQSDERHRQKRATNAMETLATFDELMTIFGQNLDYGAGERSANLDLALRQYSPGTILRAARTLAATTAFKHSDDKHFDYLIDHWKFAERISFWFDGGPPVTGAPTDDQFLEKLEKVNGA